MRPRHKASVALLLMFAGTACADPAGEKGGPPGDDDALYSVELRCAADGSTSLSSDTVQPRPDGVHLVVVNEYDEPVSVGGFDADPGRTTWVLSRGPGTIELMCWPFSDHGSGAEPPHIPLTVVDPQALYVDGTVPCEPTGITVTEWHGRPVDPGPPPLDIAREVIEGLEADDELVFGGYPQQAERSVVVRRDGNVIASYSIVRWSEEDPWTIKGGTACDGSGLPYEGEQVG